MRRKRWTNGPVFRFQINTDDNKKISGFVSRYRVSFSSEIKIEDKTEKIIIDFLKLLKYGEINSETQTGYFCKPYENNKSYWLLEESV